MESKKEIDDMLVFTMNIDESIEIGDEVTLMIVGTNCLQAKIGIKADKNISILREEIYDRTKQEKEENKKK